jgi:DNA-binding SARP family transcriptional activator
MDYRILGPLEVLDGDRALPLGGPRQRAVLALLLIRANTAVSSELIVHELWGAEPPRTASKALQNCVSALRKTLPSGVETLRSVGGGYALRVDPEELDRNRFEALVAEGRALLSQGDPDEARRRLAGALDLWRGEPLSDFAFEEFAQEEIARLQELHITTAEDKVDADLAAGLSAELVPELEVLISRNPLRERLRGQLMLALYRAGRQAEALRAYRETRGALLGELGLEPSRHLQELERAILAHDPALDARPNQRAPAAGRDTSRRGRRAAAPLVGRDEELGLLEAGLEDALSGRGRLFIVVGSPGSGKTSLADATASRAKERGAAILWGRGWHGGGAPMYWPWLQAMRDAGRELAPPATDDAAARFEFFEHVTELFRSQAAERPQLLVLDDLQSADEGSLLLLDFLASELPEMPALVLALTREESPRLDDLRRHATRVLNLDGGIPLSDPAQG